MAEHTNAVHVLMPTPAMGTHVPAVLRRLTGGVPPAVITSFQLSVAAMEPQVATVQQLSFARYVRRDPDGMQLIPREADVDSRQRYEVILPQSAVRAGDRTASPKPQFAPSDRGNRKVRNAALRRRAKVRRGKHAR